MRAFTYQQRLGLLAILGGCGLLLLFSRLVLIQGIEQGQWREEAEKLRSGWRGVRAVRGSILDAGGEFLAHDAAGFELAVLTLHWKNVRHACSHCGAERYVAKNNKPPVKCRRCGKRGTIVHADRRDLSEVARLLRTSPEELRARVEEQVRRVERIVAKNLKKASPRRRDSHEANLWHDFGRRPRRVVREVPYEVAREVDLHPELYPGLRILTSHSRVYPGGPPFAHILGGLRGTERKAEVEREGLGTRLVPIRSGASGLEYHFERDLSGEHGWVEIERDARAGEKRVVRERLPRPGATLQLTISKADQDRGAQVLADVEGAFAVVNARTGAVLVLVSTPSFDPNRPGEEAAEWERREKTFGVRSSPFFPSAYRGIHQPGSILKPFTAVAALAAGDVDLKEHIRCERIFHHKGRPLPEVLRCNAYHEESDLHRAIVKSCNIYFQTVMDRMLDREHFPVFEETGRRFGFGRRTGIEIEPEGRLAKGWDFHRTRQWSQFVASAVGQGPVALSPAQVARAYAGLATGRLPALHLVARVGDRVTAPRHESLPVPGALLEPVRNALREVPRAGTGRGYGLERWNIACKTGTAQVSRDRSLNNAWMAGFASAQHGRPPIAFAMVVLRTPFGGGHECGPRLAEFFHSFFAEKVQ